MKKNRLILSFFLVCLFIYVSPVMATDTELENARSSFNAGDFEAAADAYNQIAENDSLVQSDWLSYGMALLETGKLDEAVTTLSRVEKAGPFFPAARYQMARAFAKKKQAKKSLEYLQQAVAAGYRDDASMKTDKALLSLANREEFTALVMQAAQNARPCEFADEYGQLDFWVGDWDVYTKSGQLAGHNTITKDIHSCAVFENWRSARSSGMTGKSMNFYNPATGKWEQQWVGDDGGLIQMSADFDGTAMHFSGEHIELTGDVKKMRMTLTPLENGHVRQFIEESLDGGQTWYVWFEGIYKLKQ